MGNEKSNTHWEAELPPNYDRVGIENFIRAKYDSVLRITVICTMCMTYNLKDVNVFRCLLRNGCWAIVLFFTLNVWNYCRYEEKRWVSRDGKPKSPPERSEEKASMQWPRSAERVGHGYSGSSERLSNERKNTQPTSTRGNFPAARVSVPVPPRGPEPVSLYYIGLLNLSLCSFLPWYL